MPTASGGGVSNGSTVVPSTLIKAERKRDGAIGGGILLKYARAMGWGWIGVYTVLLLASHLLVIGSDYMLAQWVRAVGGALLGSAEDPALFQMLFRAKTQPKRARGTLLSRR